MSFTKLLNTIRDYSHEVDDLQTVNALVNSAFKDWIASKGIGQVVVLESGKIIMNINGQFNPEASQISFRGIQITIILYRLISNSSHPLKKFLRRLKKS